MCPDLIAPDTELVSAHQIRLTLESNSGETKHDHFLRCCDHLGIPGMRELLDRMLTVDFLLANEDRHMNNFGAVRDANTLEWIGPAPIFDSGTSLWHDNLFRWAGPEQDSPSKPFAARHTEQIKLVGSFDWLDRQALAGAAEDLEQILASAPRYMAEERIEALCSGFRNRVELLQEIILEHTMRGPEPLLG